MPSRKPSAHQLPKTNESTQLYNALHEHALSSLIQGSSKLELSQMAINSEMKKKKNALYCF